MRRPLSRADEEPFFLEADEACDACAAGMKSAILARFKSVAKGFNRPMLAMATSYGSASAARIVFKPREAAHVWAMQLMADERFAQKAKPTPHEAELIDAAIEAGLELGLETLPKAIRGKVDVEAARRLARKRLLKGQFRQTLAAYEESLRGLERLARSAPALTVLQDPERIASMFGLNDRQAKAIIRETQALVDAGKKTAAIKNAMAKRVEQALEARAEMMGQTLGREAISTAQNALIETAEKQGLLDRDRTLRVWVSRHDERVCPACDGLDGKTAEIGEEFVSDYDGESAFQPPLHPNCRCAIRVSVAKVSRAA